MKRTLRIPVLVSGLTLSAIVAATPVTFLFTDGSKLFRADSTGALFGSTTMSAGIQSLTRLPSGIALAGASAGDIIACANTATNGRYNLYRLDDPLGAATLVNIGSLNQGIGSLTFANGRMYGVEDSLNPLRVYTFDLATGNSSSVVNTGIAAGGGGGLAYSPAEGTFYLTDATNNRLYRWAPGGSATLVGPIGFGFSNNGLEFHGGVLYGALRRDSPSNTMSVGFFNTSTGAFTVQATTTGITGSGTGFLAVPEPGSMIALGIGALALMRRRRA